MDLQNDDIIEVMTDLHRQATTERSHFYVGAVLTRAIQEITKLREEGGSGQRSCVCSIGDDVEGKGGSQDGVEVNWRNHQESTFVGTLIFYECPKCYASEIYKSARHCPHCGVKINWVG